MIRLVGSTNITLFRNAYEHLKMHIYRPIIRRLDAFVYGSYAQMNLWKKRYKLDTAAMTVIHNGVDTEHFSVDACRIDKAEARQRFDLDPNSIVFGSVAQFRVEKAQGDLVRAVSVLRKRGCNVELLLVGDGSERAAVELLAREYGLSDHVRFAGQMDDVRPALIAMDVFVLTSVAVETFSNAALEAMSMGKPAVLSDIGGAREMVTDGYNGYVYVPGNLSELIRQLEKLLTRTEIERMAKNAKTVVAERFSAAAMTDNYEKVILQEAKTAVM
jgi:glycosyltransferase involved in cell wall biosynthesis